jgi:hypothetical protein
MHRHERELFKGRPYRMTFEEYIEFDPRVVDASDYASQLKQYIEYFPKESFLLLPFERYIKDPASTLRAIFNFLGVEDRSEAIAGDSVQKNSRDDFKEGMASLYVMEPLKRIPGLKAVYDRMPKGLRAASLSLVQKSPLSRRARRRLTPPPILPDTRKRLQERYDASAAYLADEFGFDTSGWGYENKNGS